MSGWRPPCHGVQGPIEVAGQQWDQQLPDQDLADQDLAEQDLAAALSCRRRAFGHRRSLVATAPVARERELQERRTAPWTAADLLGDG